MSSRRDAERDRDRRAAASARTNEYFVPKDGIDREVITADICRYLGNDALVRPGNYENPQTRHIQQGYFITAYRNLTTAMIADLKADSERWEAERRQVSRGHQNVEYRASTTHQSRQYYGPTTETAPAISSSTGYTSTPTGSMNPPPQVYEQSYPASGGYTQPSMATGGYTSSGYVQQDSNYYVAGANMDIDQPQPQRTSRAPVPQSGGAVPRSGPYSTTPTSYVDSRGSSSVYSYPSGQGQVSTPQYNPQPTEPFYGRAVPAAGASDYQDDYDRGTYPDTGVTYTQAPTMASTTSTTATTGSSNRRSDRDREGRDDHRRRRER